jgi:hypothetical protein
MVTSGLKDTVLEIINQWQIQKTPKFKEIVKCIQLMELRAIWMHDKAENAIVILVISIIIIDLVAENLSYRTSKIASSYCSALVNIPTMKNIEIH